MGRDAIQALPGMVMALLVILATWIGARLAARAARRASSTRVESPLLREVLAKALALPVVLLGIYFAMQVSGLTRLAATVLGGTGLLGLALGIAFRDIAENYLASILISVQRPFHPGDMIEVDGKKGLVQKVTSRGTLLMTPEGSYVQIPNATIYKGVIHNYTANPNIRLDFTVSVDYRDDVERAQDAVLDVLRDHPAVLADPEPLVLVEALNAPAVVLHAYYWINSREHSGLKVRSATIRLAKNALSEAGLRIPDGTREVVFPQGVPLSRGDVNARHATTLPRSAPPRNGSGEKQHATTSEGDLRSDRETLEAQADQARDVEDGADLLTTR